MEIDNTKYIIYNTCLLCNKSGLWGGGNIKDQFSLNDQRALITGGGGGIGRAMAEALYEAGAQVALVGRSTETLTKAVSAIESESREVFSLDADLGQESEVTRAFDQSIAWLGGIDILVVCHGTVHIEDALDHDIDSWEHTLNINLTSVFQLNQLAGRQMVSQGRGKIINVASMLSFSGGMKVPSYAASKGGVAQLTKALANEWSSKGVNVNAIAPGYIRTNLNKHIWSDPVRSQQVLDRLPSGRWGDPSDLKGATVFLASAASDYVHGVVFPVDGGWLAR